MYFLLLIAITLGAAFVVHGALSLLAVTIWQFSRKRIARMSPRKASQFLLWLRLAPFIATVIAALIFIIPAFLEYEPHSTQERISVSIGLFALISLLIVFGGLRRSISAILQSNRVMHEWMKDSEEQSTQLEGVSVHRCHHDSPVIAVLGLWRTRIFVSNQVFEKLSSEELNAALRHEAVHARSKDTFKKLALHFSPKVFPAWDLLAPIRESWAKACELSADEEAAAHDAQRTLSLASALVKVSRLSCPTEIPTIGAALMNDTESFLGYRVQRLLQISENGSGSVVTTKQNVFPQWTVFPAALLLLTTVAYPQALSLTHELLEIFVRSW
ncbi:MAG: peptidase BlaR1 [Candidatus Angelobacter sp.]|nr:peptidase BlaR1 [Candidatus Angelobacter sp.]